MYVHIPKARPAPVDDRTLATLTQIAFDAQSGNCSPAEAEWLLNCAGPLLKELADHRAAAKRASAHANVVALPAGGR